MFVGVVALRYEHIDNEVPQLPQTLSESFVESIIATLK